MTKAELTFEKLGGLKENAAEYSSKLKNKASEIYDKIKNRMEPILEQVEAKTPELKVKAKTTTEKITNMVKKHPIATGAAVTGGAFIAGNIQGQKKNIDEYNYKVAQLCDTTMTTGWADNTEVSKAQGIMQKIKASAILPTNG